LTYTIFKTLVQFLLLLFQFTEMHFEKSQKHKIFVWLVCWRWPLCACRYLYGMNFSLTLIRLFLMEVQLTCLDHSSGLPHVFACRLLQLMLLTKDVVCHLLVICWIMQVIKKILYLYH